MNDLETKIFGRFDDDTIVHPGHGDDTTLGAERPISQSGGNAAGNA
jgi:glyoxylase-like metal-dependent hydrolase (beta-lactamase superfamily II)